MWSDRPVDYHQMNVKYFVYLFFLFIDFKDLPLSNCKEIHYSKLKTCKGTTNKYSTWSTPCREYQVAIGLDIKTYRGQQQLQTGKQRQWTNRMPASFSRQFVLVSCLKSVAETITNSIKDIEDNTWLLYMKFLFSCWTWYLTRSLRLLMRYQFQHLKTNSISTSSHVLFCLLHKHTNDEFLDDFPKISEHFPQISEDSPKVVRRTNISVPNISEIPKITENFRRRTDDVLI